MKSTRQKIYLNFLQGLLYILGLAGYLHLTLSDVTKFQRESFSEIVLENSLILAGIILFYLLTHFLPGWIASPLRWTGLLGLSGVFLKGYWIIKRSAYFQVYGVLPNVDAAEYYHNAIRLLTGFPAQGTTISRPFFPAFLSSILWSAKLDIHLALIILVALVIFTIFLFGESVRNRFGIIPAAMTVGMTFMFYSNYLGAFSSESLGLIFGCLAWVFFFESATNPSKRYFFLGMVFLILGMFTRAGALLILPTMVIAFLLFYPKKRDRVWYLAGSLVVFGVIYLVNSNILNILSANSSYLFPNSLYSFYGMAAGGHGWGYFKIARPDIWAMEEPIRTQMLFQATIELIKANPLVLIVNMLKQFYYFVLLGNTSVFSYLFTTIRGYNIGLLVVLYSASCWTIVQLIRRRTKLSSLILLAILVGILFSIPFVPPQDESDMRAYAVTVPVMALIPALAIQDWASILWKKFPRRLTAKINLQTVPLDQRWISVPSIIFGVAIAALAILPTYTMRGIGKPDLPIQSACPSGQKSVTWEYQRKNSIRIVKNQEPIGIFSIRMSQVERLMHDIYFAPHLGVFQSMADGISVSQQVNLKDGASGWFLVPDSIIDAGDGIYSGCAAFHDDENFYLFDFFKVETGQTIR